MISESMEIKCMNTIKQCRDASYLQRDYLLLSFPSAWIQRGFLKIHLSAPLLVSFHLISRIPAYSIIHIPGQLWLWLYKLQPLKSKCCSLQSTLPFRSRGSPGRQGSGRILACRALDLPLIGQLRLFWFCKFSSSCQQSPKICSLPGMQNYPNLMVTWLLWYQQCVLL